MTSIHANFISTYLKPQVAPLDCQSEPITNPAAMRAMAMYSDWQPTPADWPENVMCRQNTPHVFHQKLGRWVPSDDKFSHFADIREWLNMMDDRKNYQASFQTWYDTPRPSRTPYMSLA
jgi:hypothetical protein